MSPSTRVAVVTGGARGLGAATALRLARAGMDIAIVDLDPRAAEVCEEIRGAGRRAISVAADVADRTQIEEAFAKTADELGGLHVLVSNAGIVRDSMFHKMSDEDWDAVIATNLRGGFVCGQIAQRYMVSNRFGKMVFLSSRAQLGSRGQANYAASKAGIVGLARTLAVELGRFNVNVNVVVPGHIDTEMTRNAAVRAGIDYEQMCERTIERNSIKRVGRPEDIADAIAFLVSDDASYITGEVLHVTGRPPM